MKAERGFRRGRCREAPSADDGVLATAQLMGEANLPFRRMALLRAEQIGEPDRWPMAVENLFDDLVTASAADHAKHDLVGFG